MSGGNGMVVGGFVAAAVVGATVVDGAARIAGGAVDAGAVVVGAGTGAAVEAALGDGVTVVARDVCAAAASSLTLAGSTVLNAAQPAPATKQLQISAARLALTAVTVLLAAVRAASPRRTVQ